MDTPSYTPNHIQRVIVVKLVKKLLAFMAPSFNQKSKRQAQCYALVEQVREFERELLRCTPVAEMEIYTKELWTDLQNKKLPYWIITALFDTLSFTEEQHDKAPSLQKAVLLKKMAKCIGYDPWCTIGELYELYTDTEGREFYLDEDGDERTLALGLGQGVHVAHIEIVEVPA